MSILRNIEWDTGVQQDTLSAHWLGFAWKGSLCTALFLTARPSVNHEVNSLAIYSPVLFNLLRQVIRLLTGLNSKRWIVQHKTKWHRRPNQYVLVVNCNYADISQAGFYQGSFLLGRPVPRQPDGCWVQEAAAAWGMPTCSWAPHRLLPPTLTPPARGWNH